MKILIIHTHYQQHGGEDVVFQQECKLLSNSEEVREVHFYNQTGWKGLFMFLCSVWNPTASTEIRKHLLEFKPDIVHLHNWHFAPGPIIIRTITRNNFPLVATLHNFRLLCPSGILFIDGQVDLTSTQTKFPWKAIWKKAYRNSVIQTFWLAFVVWFHKRIGTWKLVTKYIVHTDFSKKLHASSSLDIASSKFVVNPNFLNSSSRTLVKRHDYFLFVGRLTEEKGVRTLLKAFENTTYRLSIAGDGPLQNFVEQTASKCSNISYLGRLEKAQIIENLQKCTALIFPSVWFEGMPMTIIESFSVGTPVIASNLGAMATMIKHGSNGLHFEAGNSDELLKQLNYWVALSEKGKEQFYINSEREYEDNYSPVKVKAGLLSIYKAAIHEKAN